MLSSLFRKLAPGKFLRKRRKETSRSKNGSSFVTKKLFVTPISKLRKPNFKAYRFYTRCLGHDSQKPAFRFWTRCMFFGFLFAGVERM
ncbi:hypothetical protein CEXT_633761 [Caerostris extrusa]|uniref:Uncharacterized protein n=1 Tax=Caerostris extrusa TaxID=172846 RepID=A0AAV4UNT6_CAEEX|nr:hypothetical protein CEXT_633761 [Caerostris extrusa]